MTDSRQWHRGRKEMVEYLRPFLLLPSSPDGAWKKIKRWKNKYGLPIEYEPNGRPFLDQRVFELYWTRFRKKQKQNRPRLTPL